MSYLFTMNACITPGNHPKRVSKILINKVVLIPWFKATATGGNNMFKIIVNNDIINVFKIIYQS